MQIRVLNLVIRGIPSILMKLSNLSKDYLKVLNLVIRGIPSILLFGDLWMKLFGVLNLIITGMPSIR